MSIGYKNNNGCKLQIGLRLTDWKTTIKTTIILNIIAAVYMLLTIPNCGMR